MLNTDYTLCIEILNRDYKLWHKTKVSIDKSTSHGLTFGNVSVNTKTEKIFFSLCIMID